MSDFDYDGGLKSTEVEVILARQPSKRTLYVFATAHFFHDLYTGAWIIILAAQRGNLDLSYTEVGIAQTVYTIASALAQPGFGNYFDRTGKPYRALWAVAATTLMVLFGALAPHYTLFLFFSALAGTGSASFHSAALTGAKRLSAGRKPGRATAIFLLGGNSGYACGMLVAGVILDKFGAGFLTIPALVGIFGAPLFIRHLKPFLSGSIPHTSRTSREILRGGRALWLPIVIFWIAVLFNQGYQGGYSTYLPQLYEKEGYSLSMNGALTWLYLLFAAIGSFFGGSLSDRFSRRSVAITAMVLTAPLTYLLLRSEGIPLAILSVLLGLMTNVPLPIMLLIGQDVLPGGANASGSYAFGLTFFARAITAPIVGLLADFIGLVPSMTFVGLLPLLSVPLIFYLPEGAAPRYDLQESNSGVIYDTRALAEPSTRSTDTLHAGD
jgi:MFS transporter, FSR family, fosmidomycin resistance protein